MVPVAVQVALFEYGHGTIGIQKLLENTLILGLGISNQGRVPVPDCYMAL